MESSEGLLGFETEGASRVAERIKPRTLKGFRDYLPQAMLAREQLIDTAREVFRRYGFAPIDTPALEYLEILTGKGGEETDKQLYKFQDHGGRWVGLRFDLTVPLARFAAQHFQQLGTPLKRYHIAPVWRGENTQRGRYREFLQCDFDTLGSESLTADIETVLVIHDLLRALGLEEFTIRVNNRRVLNGWLELLGLKDQATAVLRALDKLAKVGPEKVIQEMIQRTGATPHQAQEVLRLAQIQGPTDQVLRQAAELLSCSELGTQGVEELSQLVRAAQVAGVPPQRLCVDLSIARGLDYYTGTVYETFLVPLPQIGSVCSGGRYDNLVELYSPEHLPGVGASLGLDRLLAAMEELGLLPQGATPAQVLLVHFQTQDLEHYLQVASALRAQGVNVDLFPEPKRLEKQLKYADRRGFRFALILGPDELEQGCCQLKDLQQRSSRQFPLDELEQLAQFILQQCSQGVGAPSGKRL